MTRSLIRAACFVALLPALAGAQPTTPATAAAPAAPTTTPLPALDTGATFFRDVHVIPMGSQDTLRHHSVLVRNGMIERLAPAGSFAAPEGAVVVDGAGKSYLLPGLCDLHLHFPPMSGVEGDASWRAATLLLANGVTTARGMIGHPTHLELRKRLVEGTLLGPTIHVAGPPVLFQSVKSPEAAATMVADHHKAGFDFIKSHRVISPDIYAAVEDAAAKAGMPVTGHVDNEVGLTAALQTTQQIEHLDGFFAAILKDPAPASTFGQMPPPHLKDQFDAARIPDVAASIAAAETWTGPTMALFRNIALAHEPAAKWNERPELKYIMPQAREQWIKQREAMGAQGPFADPAFASWFVETRASMLRALRDADEGKGAERILACSDSPQAFLVTGFALHDELAAMVDAGLTPRQALAAATSNAAAYFATLSNRGSALGIAPDFGVIAPGKRADLVLLASDPTVDIAATRTIESVMVRGRLFDRAALDAMLAKVEASTKPPTAPAP